MRLIIQNGRVVATALDAYTGPDAWITAPAGFDPARSADYTVVDGQLQVGVDRAIARIDADTDAITTDVIGARQAEYQEAERQAQAFAAAGYAGSVPGMVRSWAVAKSWTDRAAADDILAQASAWRGAQELIRAQRLLRKEQVKAATGPAAREAVLATWGAFVVAIRSQLGV